MKTVLHHYYINTTDPGGYDAYCKLRQQLEASHPGKFFNVLADPRTSSLVGNRFSLSGDRNRKGENMKTLSWDNHKRSCPIHFGKWHFTALDNGSWICAKSIKEKRAIDREHDEKNSNS